MFVYFKYWHFFTALNAINGWFQVQMPLSRDGRVNRVGEKYILSIEIIFHRTRIVPCLSTKCSSASSTVASVSATPLFYLTNSSIFVPTTILFARSHRFKFLFMCNEFICYIVWWHSWKKKYQLTKQARWNSVIIT